MFAAFKVLFLIIIQGTGDAPGTDAGIMPTKEMIEDMTIPQDKVRSYMAKWPEKAKKMRQSFRSKINKQKAALKIKQLRTDNQKQVDLEVQRQVSFHHNFLLVQPA
jgi:hypothetical protein